MASIFKYLKGFYSTDLSIDLGTANTLVFVKDKIAMNLKQCIDDTIKDLSSRQKSNSKIKKAHKQYLPILEDILLELNGDGSNPELLFDIYNM